MIRSRRLLLALFVALGWAPHGSAQDDPVLVTAEWLAQRLDQVTLINVHYRTDAFAVEHIPGAQFVGWGEFVSNDDPGAEMMSVAEMVAVFVDAGVRSDRPVVFYAPQTIPAARGFLTLEYLGHQSVHVLDGGVAAWKNAGFETESGEERETLPGAFTPNLQEDILVDSQWIMRNLDVEGVTLIDARPDGEYTGDGVEVGNARGLKPGHIPGANQLYYEDLVSPADDARFLDLDDLVARFESANAKEGDTLVSYCMVGMRASVTYMVSRHLGFDAKFYDWSWSDWSKTDLPVVEGRAPGGN